MKIEVVEDLAQILDSYEITVTNGIFSIAKNESKNVEGIGLQETYTDKDIADDDEVFPEGKKLTELHKRKERNSKAVRKKKKKVLQESGKLECEVCGFDFVRTYGEELGYGFAECHHTFPVSKLTEEQKTKLSDLAIVCANCHRMLHKLQPVTRTIYSISELQAVVQKMLNK